MRAGWVVAMVTVVIAGGTRETGREDTDTQDEVSANRTNTGQPFQDGTTT